MQIILVAFGAVVAVGGLVLLVRSAGRGDDARRGYMPFGMIVVGLIVAYKSFSDFRTMDSQDITIIFLFALALFTLFGLQFFVVERNRHFIEAPNDPEPGKSEREDTK